MKATVIYMHMGFLSLRSKKLAAIKYMTCKDDKHTNAAFMQGFHKF